MKRFVLVSVALAGGLLAVGGCSTVRCWFLKGECLTYDQYLSIDQSASPKPTAEEVLKKLGTPQEVHDRDGVRRRIDYHCWSLTGDMKTAEFTFDEQEHLVKKELW